nr:GNAT family N-acetyltransferase [Fictibacillus macauensis]
MSEDFERLHQWMNEPHVIPYWQLNGPKAAFKQHLEQALADQHQTLYIGCIDGVPMSYWESYWVKDDVLASYYDALPYDQGVHLLIGEPSYLGKGLALPLLKAMVAFQWQDQRTTRIVAEPHYLNEKMIRVFQACGFEKQATIQLPDKKAQLMMCDRETFNRRWQHENERVR